LRCHSGRLTKMDSTSSTGKQVVSTVQEIFKSKITYHEKTKTRFLMDLVIATAPLVLSGYMLYRYYNMTQKTPEIEEARKSLHELLQRNGRSTDLHTNRYEDRIMPDILFPDQISTTFDDIGGLKSIQEQVIETVILPLNNPHLFAIEGKSSSLISPPKGVLFYGPPGTGKTMMAKAIAKQCGATFINVRFSTLENKWVGESEKIARAVFSLAHKLAPTIIFIDEIDMFFSKRTSSTSSDNLNSLKAEFMSLWDGLTTSDQARVTVLAATNRPYDIDQAILRRMPRTFLFDLPDAKERALIMRVCLRDQNLADDVDIAELAVKSEGYSGSDLKELCKLAAMAPVRELLRKHWQEVKTSTSDKATDKNAHRVEGKPRSVSMKDFFDAMEQVKATGKTSSDYRLAESLAAASASSSSSSRAPFYFSIQPSSAPSSSPSAAAPVPSIPADYDEYEDGDEDSDIDADAADQVD